MRTHKLADNFHSTCATILAASLGQGLIYMCITERVSLPLATLAIFAIAMVVAGCGAAARAVREQRLASSR